MRQPKDFKLTVDFNLCGGSYANIEEIIKKYGIPRTYIEIGCFEGSTLFWLAEQLPSLYENVKMYAIDPHDTSADLTDVNLKEVKENFLYNLDVCTNKKNIEYIPEYSNKALVKLINEGVTADLIYIDGDHRAGGVLTDLVLSFELLNVGGIMLCDDSVFWRYKDKEGQVDPHLSPRMAVESFLFCNWNRLRPLILPDSSQTGLLKLC